MRALFVVAILGSACGGTVVDCSQTFCGCWESTSLTVSARVVDSQSGAAISGVTAKCRGNESVGATSGADGRFTFSLETKRSPGCGFSGCNNVQLEDPAGVYLAVEASAVSLSEGEVSVSLQKQ